MKSKAVFIWGENGKYYADLHGPRLNINQLILDNPSQSNDKTEEFFVNANFDEVYVWDLPPIKKVNLKLQNNAVTLPKIEMSGHVYDQPVYITSWAKNGVRNFRFSSSDAGRVLKGLEIIDSLIAGEIVIKGKIINNNKSEKTSANISIQNFGVKDAPLFTQVLNSASLIGLVDTLQGKGIQFQHLNAEAIFTKDRIQILDSFAYGASLGVSATGTIIRSNKAASIKGMIVPAYGLNRLIDKIPILGRILTGGEKEGLLAAEYLITQSLEEPIITVNPLTAFTPGFLRSFVKATRKPLQ